MRTAVGTETSESPISVSPMYTNRPKSVILDGVDGKCILAGEHDGPIVLRHPPVRKSHRRMVAPPWQSMM